MLCILLEEYFSKMLTIQFAQRVVLDLRVLRKRLSFREMTIQRLFPAILVKKTVGKISHLLEIFAQNNAT